VPTQPSRRDEASVTAALYQRPRALAEALGLMEEPGAVVLCGGTDFYPERLHQPRYEAVVDISDIAELRGIELVGESWRFGATTTWREVHEASLPIAFDGLRQAAGLVGGVQIQNAGTVGGNLCTASPAGDGVPPLLSLDARVELRSVAGTRELELSKFLTGYRQTALRPGEILSAVLVSATSEAARGSFAKFGIRSHLVISIAMVGAVIVVDEGIISEARVAVGACSPVALRLASVERSLVGCEHKSEAVGAVISECDLSMLTPIDDVRASSDFRSRLVRQLIGDAVMCTGEQP